MAANVGVSCQLRVEYCTGGCEDRTSACEAEEFQTVRSHFQGTSDDNTAGWKKVYQVLW
jgi:hypothetical protein